MTTFATEGHRRDETAADVGARVLRGVPAAAEIRERVAANVDDFRIRRGFSPTLAIVIVGQEAASAVYLQQILRSCGLVGIPGRVVDLPADSSAGDLERAIFELNDDPQVGGIIVQMPLPPWMPARTVVDSIAPEKDIDGIHPLNMGLMTLGYEGFLPACAEAAVHILKHGGFELEGRRAVVIGRSNVVGKPVQLLLIREHCTVSVCHRRTRDLVAEIERADVVVVAAGSPGLVRGEMLKPGALVVDVGFNVVGDRIVGDVDYESAVPVAAAITPVPGGVGPVTNAILVEHLVRAARAQADGSIHWPARRTSGVAHRSPPT